MSISHIAVCTDFSEESRRAFPLAASIARTLSARLSLVHLAEQPGVPAFASLGVGPPDLPEELEAYFESIETRLGDLIWSDAVFDGTEAKPRLLRDGGFEALAEFLNDRDEDISLLVMTTHGYTGAKRFVFGSFALKVMHMAPCPVLVVRESLPEAKAGPSDRGAGEAVPKRIFLATDLSPRSARAFDLALSWGRQFDASLLVHFVVEKPSGIAGYPRFMLEGWWEHEQKLRDEGCRKLARNLDESGEGVDARYVVTAGEPALEILREVEDFKADLAILGTHGRSSFEDFMLGSVVRKVIGRASCSVLIVPPHGAAG